MVVQVITRGSDQVAISLQFEVRNDPAVTRNFGSILTEYSKIVPEGIVAFFPIIFRWSRGIIWWGCSIFCLEIPFACVTFRANQGILDDAWKYKFIFVETPDGNETSIALEN